MMNKTELVAAVAEKAALSKKDAEKAVGAVVDNWNINTADALMYVLSTVLDYDFFETILKKVGLDLSQGIGATVLTMADKENDLVDVLVMLLNDYKVGNSPVETTTVVLDNVITVNGGFSK